MRNCEQHKVLNWLQQILAERFGHVFFLLPAAGNCVRLGREGSSQFIEVDSALDTFSGVGSDLPFATWDANVEGWRSALGQPLPAPGLSDLDGRLIEKTDSGYRVRYDIFGLMYWILSRREEVGRQDLDDHGRFPAKASHAWRHGYLERPIVDEWLDILKQVIQRLWPALPLTQHRGSIRVSHDVDMPSRYGFIPMSKMVRRIAADVLKHNDFRSALTAPMIWRGTRTGLHPRDPSNTFGWIMDTSERKGLASAFYFICGRTQPDRDADYEPEHPAIRDLMRRIHFRGHEIGLHPSYNTYRTPTALAGEADRLRRICAQEGIHQDAWGGRMHFLRWEQPTTLRSWDLAGIAYDSTLSYADRPGFRCGTCFEYPAFDPVDCRPLKVRVRPLIAMECTIMAARYMNLGTGEAAFRKFHELLERCKAVDGCFTMLWHNSELIRPQQRALYQAILDEF